MATIKDIAKTLNISVSTVSYALNGGPRPVPAHVRESVLATAKELGYRPNKNARSLITRKTNTIGVVPPQLGANIVVSPFLRDSLNGIINEAEACHYDVLLFTKCDQTETERMLDDVLDGRVDGLFFLAPPIGTEAVDRVHAFGLPTVLTCSHAYLPPAYTCDNEQGVRLAIEHLASLGHRRIGHISGRAKLEDSILREQFFTKQMRETGLECRPEWITSGDFTSFGGYDAGMTIFHQPERPTAIFCANDEMAVGLMRAAGDFGLRVPSDLSVVGFDDSYLCSFTFPPLTSVRQPIETLAAYALRSLVGMIEGDPPAKSKMFETELIVRDSTAPAPAHVAV